MSVTALSTVDPSFLRSGEPAPHGNRETAKTERDLAPICRLISEKLKPKILDIDLKAEYPQDFLHELGTLGGFRGGASPSHGGNGLGLKHVIHVMEAVSRLCLSSGFLVWCQTACARYIHMSENEQLKEKFLPAISSGGILAGTGLSNTVKSCDAIEEFRLSAKRATGGYVVNGVLPWVSNLGPAHYFATGCPVEGAGNSTNGLVFVLVDCSQPGFKLVDCAHFIALDGTRTLACHFKDCFIPDERVLAHTGQAEAYVKRIKPGMVLAQMGMPLGLVEDCIGLIRQSNRTHSHVNHYLDDQADEISEALLQVRNSTYSLAEELTCEPNGDFILDILKIRLAGSELAVRAAGAAMLHQGAKGYLLRSAAQRRLREAYFVAIVTPAIKHLRHEIARIEEGSACG